MLLDRPGSPLRLADVPEPEAGRGRLRLRVEACGVCRTDLHLRDGELEPGHLPLILGHQIVACVDGGDERVGVPWLGWTCGDCVYCRSGRENLCVRARFTGRDIDGGYAEWTVADERFCFPLPGDADAHIICQVAVHERRRVFAFTRAGDDDAQALARSLGAEWAGDAMAPGPEPLDAALIFAPAGALVPAALRAVAPGGTVVCAGIHMSDIPSFPYRDLWEERVLRSVANLTRAGDVTGAAVVRIGAAA